MSGLRVEYGLGEANPMEVAFFRMLRTSAEKVAEEMGMLSRNAPIEEQELRMFSACTNYAEVRHTCNVIKMRRAETYPSDWWQKVMNTGLHAAVLQRTENPENPDFKTQVEKIILPMFGVTR